MDIDELSTAVAPNTVFISDRLKKALNDMEAVTTAIEESKINEGQEEKLTSIN